MVRPEGADGVERSVRLERLGTLHADDILAGQDRALAQEVFGCRWEREGLAEFLERAQRWRPEGPVREFAARPIPADPSAEPTSEPRTGPTAGPTGGVVGGGGLHLLGPGLDRGQADMSYWVLAPHRGHGWGAGIVRALREVAAGDPRIRTLILRIAPQNEASRRVARGAGARPTSRYERHPGDARRRVERWELALDPSGEGRHGGTDSGGGNGGGTTLAR
ncbi:GNAT family N-acetyltransferase [Brachybacterium subflavum]|uniref:GNAT family N-acetyltransferase n=1 Tax=Brachybacterium subflavum TaxID=2585206 RepID=UPI0012665453|nr:GNAT family N-acetyltransferase [Brachybacterium subflavum]